MKHLDKRCTACGKWNEIRDGVAWRCQECIDKDKYAHTITDRIIIFAFYVILIAYIILAIKMSM